MIISFRCKSTREASLSFLELPVAQRVGHIPADADQDHVDRKAHPFEVEHINSSRVRAPKLTRLASRLSLMRQNQEEHTSVYNYSIIALYFPIKTPHGSCS